MSITDSLRLGIVATPIAVILAWGVVRLRRGRAAVLAAIEREGYEVVRIERRVLRQGPLFWTTTRSQSVYRVVARDVSGREHMGWARWGRTWLFTRDSLELRWEKQS